MELSEDNLTKNFRYYQQVSEKFGATLVVVSKTRTVADIQRLYDLGHRDFGENKVQEMCEKYEALPKDIRWHMIGHLQRNKVKYLAPFVYLIQSVDSLRLLKEVDKQAEKVGRPINCLLQMHIAEEESKFGLDNDELNVILNEYGQKKFSHVNLLGLMGMATNTNKNDQVAKEFGLLKSELSDIAARNQFENDPILSMGMSGDHEIALQNGSTLVRIGSAIFGARE